MLTRLRKTTTAASSELTYTLNRVNHSRRLPRLPELDAALVTRLRQEGVCVTSLDELALPTTSRLLSAASSLIEEVPPASSVRFEGDRSVSSHCVHAGPNRIMAYPDIFRWGLQERLLNLAESYIGLPVAYRGVVLRRDAPNGRQVGTRLWHLDGEDRRMVKMIVYLNDVGEDGGPFEYIPRQISPSYRPFQTIHCKIKDVDMAKVVPSSQWKACPGKMGTVVMVDTASVFHHGKVPTSERLALIFTYFSRQPKRPTLCKSSFSPDLIAPMVPNFSPRQHACVMGWRSR
ncbi:MAG: 2OG-Fe(II) oxygenase [Elainellaceae cyanobacterium]